MRIMKNSVSIDHQVVAKLYKVSNVDINGFIEKSKTKFTDRIFTVFSQDTRKILYKW